MTKSVWITRALPSADASARAWQALGLAPLILPLLEINPAPDRPEPPPANAALVFTSKNAVFAFQAVGFKSNNRVFTVGDATAQAARLAGFKEVMSASGTSEDVTELVKSSLPKDIRVIHCGGRHVRGQTCEDLQAAGYTARRDIYYQSEPVTAWPNVDMSNIGYIAFYSPLAARTFFRLYKIASREGRVSFDIHKLTIISISEATNAQLGDIRPKARYVAATPNEAAMLALIKP